MKKSLMASTLGLLAGRLTLPFFSFLLFFITARTLSMGDFGLYVLLTGLITLFQGLASLGLGQLLSREIGKRPEDEGVHIGSAMVIILPASVLAYFVFLLLAFLLKGPGEFLVLAGIIGLSLPFSSTMFVMESVFVVRGAGTSIFYLGMLEQAARVGLSVIALLHGFGLYGLVVAYVISRGLAVVGSAYFYFRHEGRSPVCCQPDHVKAMLVQLRSFAPIMIIGLLLYRSDVLTLGWFLTDEEMGIYGCAIRIVNLSFIGPDSVVAATFPDMSRRWTLRDPGFAESTVSLLEFLIALGLAGVVAMAILAPYVVPTVFGSKFTASVPLLAMLAYLLPSHTLELQAGNLFQAIGREKTALLLMCISLVPFFGLISLGAVWGGLYGSALGFLAASWLMGLISIICLPGEAFALRWRSSLARALVMLVVLVPPILVWRPESDLVFCYLLAGVALTVICISGSIKNLHLRQIRAVLS